MNLQQHKRDDLDVNITPLIDIVFLLLIFFMVSTTFERESEIDITLPEAVVDAGEQSNNEPIEITISADGTFFAVELQRASGGNPDPVIVINADANATHQAVVSVMDAARQLGFIHLSFATSQITENQ